MKFQPGDKLRVPGVIGTLHYGIFVGRVGSVNCGVVHNAKGRGVVLSEFDEFAMGATVALDSRTPGGWWAQQRVAQRALALIGQRYDLVNFNCEHAATLAQTGQAVSRQVEGFALAVLLVLGVLVLSDASPGR